MKASAMTTRDLLEGNSLVQTITAPTTPEVFLVSVAYVSKHTRQAQQMDYPVVSPDSIGGFVDRTVAMIEESLGRVTGYRVFEMEGALRAL